MPRALGLSVYTVIFKTLLCQHHDINSKLNTYTSSTTVFVCSVTMELPEIPNKDKRVEGLPKDRTSDQNVTPSLN